MRLKEHCEEISPYLPVHAHTLSPDKLLLYLVKLLPCTQQGHTLIPTTQKVVSNGICGFFLCLNTIAGGGIGRKREAAILELLLHRQWLVQCNIQLYSAFSELVTDFNYVKVCQSSKWSLPDFCLEAVQCFPGSWEADGGSFVANPDGPHHTDCCPYLLVPYWPLPDCYSLLGGNSGSSWQSSGMSKADLKLA